MGGFLSATEIVDIVQRVRDAGTIGLLLFILISGARGWWVFGNIYRDMRQERDTWRAQAMRGTTNAERATNVADVITKALDEAYPTLRTQAHEEGE